MCTAGCLPKSRPLHLWLSAGLKIKFKVTLLKSPCMCTYINICIYTYINTLWPGWCLPVACPKGEVLPCLLLVEVVSDCRSCVHTQVLRWQVRLGCSVGSWAQRAATSHCHIPLINMAVPPMWPAWDFIIHVQLQLLGSRNVLKPSIFSKSCTRWLYENSHSAEVRRRSNDFKNYQNKKHNKLNLWPCIDPQHIIPFRTLCAFWYPKRE